VGGWSPHCDLPGSSSPTRQTQQRHCHATGTNSKLRPHSWNQLHLPLRQVSVKFNIYCLSFRHKFLVYHMLFIKRSSTSFWPSIFENLLASQIILFSTPCFDVLFQDHIETAITCLFVSSNAGTEKIWTVLRGMDGVSTCSDHVPLLLIQESMWNKFNVYLILSQLLIKNMKNCFLVNMQFTLHEF
jgi:hypothetical protein